MARALGPGELCTPLGELIAVHKNIVASSGVVCRFSFSQAMQAVP
jgi:hypothetical protein